MKNSKKAESTYCGRLFNYLYYLIIIPIRSGYTLRVIGKVFK